MNNHEGRHDGARRGQGRRAPRLPREPEGADHEVIIISIIIIIVTIVIVITIVIITISINFYIIIVKHNITTFIIITTIIVTTIYFIIIIIIIIILIIIIIIIIIIISIIIIIIIIIINNIIRAEAGGHVPYADETPIGSLRSLECGGTAWSEVQGGNHLSNTAGINTSFLQKRRRA